MRDNQISKQTETAEQTDIKVLQHKDTIRRKMQMFENILAKSPDAKYGDDCAPLKHTFLDGLYVREIFMPKGLILTSKIHKTRHPYFVLSGDCSVLTDDGVVHIKAPYFGITEPGTKRVLYIHEDTHWITVHATEETDLEAIERIIIAKDFNDPDLPFNKNKEIEKKEKKK